MTRLALALVLVALPAAADEEIIIGLSQDEVSITTDFAGSEILIFGAIKREAPVPPGPPAEVIVTVAGPPAPMTVRRKERVAGIWVNTESAEIRRAPSYYAVASTAALGSVLSREADRRFDISLPRAIARAIEAGAGPERDRFVEALIRLQADAGHYRTEAGGVELTDQTLFESAIALPADLTEGTYAVRIFLLREGEVIEEFGTAIAVGRVGLERWLFDLAHEYPFWYGMLALVIALGAGWGASALFRYVRAG